MKDTTIPIQKVHELKSMLTKALSAKVTYSEDRELYLEKVIQEMRRHVKEGLKLLKEVRIPEAENLPEEDPPEDSSQS